MFEIDSPTPVKDQYWCMRCGAPATYLMASMDPDYGIGLCTAGFKNHDRILVTARRDEIERWLALIAKNRAAIRAERKRVGGRQSSVI